MSEFRLGDVIDDHCIKCRRITNHSIVSLVDSAPAKVRCRTCYQRSRLSPRAGASFQERSEEAGIVQRGAGFGGVGGGRACRRRRSGRRSAGDIQIQESQGARQEGVTPPPGILSAIRASIPTCGSSARACSNCSSLRAGERILDIGCGTGQLTAEIARIGRRSHRPGQFAENAREARKNYPQLKFVAGDAAGFRFPESFDAVFSNAALHWVKDHGAAAASIAQAIRPGGRFVTEFGGKGCIASIVVGHARGVRRRSRSTLPVELRQHRRIRAAARTERPGSSPSQPVRPADSGGGRARHRGLAADVLRQLFPRSVGRAGARLRSGTGGAPCVRRCIATACGRSTIAGCGWSR